MTRLALVDCNNFFCSCEIVGNVEDLIDELAVEGDQVS